MILAFAALLLTVGRWVIHRILPWIQAHTGWPGGVLSFALTAALFCAALTEWMGVHAIFGAFLFGVALGDSNNLREQTRATMDRFINFFFAPLFFASIGLKVDFIAHFDPMLVAIVLIIASIGKIIGCGLGARWAGMPKREAWAVGFGMNARGAMEIILGLLALQAGVIRERMFVALVVMALVTSMISGPMMQRLLREKKARRFTSYLSRKTFARPLESTDRWEAIAELSQLAAAASELDRDVVTAAVCERERIMATGLANGVAVPHARIADISAPIIAAGISEAGVDFDAADGEPARLVFLILTPALDDGSQLDILADIARTFSDPRAVDRAATSKGLTELLAAVSAAPSRAAH
jgi:mannitol/fructose-specific phosphotransferase system IIA component (Ntr-type)